MLYVVPKTILYLHFEVFIVFVFLIWFKEGQKLHKNECHVVTSQCEADVHNMYYVLHIQVRSNFTYESPYAADLLHVMEPPLHKCHHT